MNLRIICIHLDLSKSEQRHFVVKSLKEFGEVADFSTFTSYEQSQAYQEQPDCLLVHGSQSGDLEKAKEYCSRSNGKRLLIIFGLDEGYKPCDTYGYFVPVTTFIANAYGFFAEWCKRGAFPGWEFLIREPELENALQILYDLLPAVAGEAPADVSRQWRALEVQKDLYSDLASTGELAASWNEAEIEYKRCIDRSIPFDPESLTRLRNSLLGNDTDCRTGLISILIQLRKAQ